MAKAKHTNVKGTHKDSATKNTLNPPAGGMQMASQGDNHADQEQDPKRRIGQHGGAGEPPMMKK
jgi:hypothetical protein